MENILIQIFYTSYVKTMRDGNILLFYYKNNHWKHKKIK